MDVVCKYGGSSLATISKIKQVAKWISKIKKEDDNLVIVVSAMGKTTDMLTEMASQLTSNANGRELDALLASGEQQSAALLTMALHSLNVPAVSLNGSQAGMITSDRHMYARIADIDVRNIKHYLQKRHVVIITGFQGIDPAGNITTLGRGGSDTTAVAIAAKLGYDCEIYTDVKGVYNIDPRVFKQASRYQKLSYDEMMELASLGAGVLETRSIELAKKYHVKLYLGKSLEQEREGTYIMDISQTDYMESMKVSGVSIFDNCALLELKGKENAELLDELFAIITDLDISATMISQKRERDQFILSFSCSEQQAKDLIKVIKSRNLQLITKHKSDLIRISVVALGMKTHPSIAARIFHQMHKNKIPYYQVASSEISLSLTLDSAFKNKAVNAIGKEFCLDRCEKGMMNDEADW